MRAVAVANTFDSDALADCRAELAAANLAIAKFREIFDACKEARDRIGYRGSLPECIWDLGSRLSEEIGRRQAAELRLAKQDESLIKALTWQAQGPEASKAMSSVGVYYVSQQQWVLTGCDAVSRRYANDEEARLAAQADFRSRILSGLSTDDRDHVLSKGATVNTEPVASRSNPPDRGKVTTNAYFNENGDAPDWSDSIAAIAATLSHAHTKPPRQTAHDSRQPRPTKIEPPVAGQSSLPLSELEWQDEFQKTIDGLLDALLNDGGGTRR